MDLTTGWPRSNVVVGYASNNNVEIVVVVVVVALLWGMRRDFYTFFCLAAT